MESNRGIKTITIVLAMTFAVIGYRTPLGAQSGGALKVTSFPSGAKVSIDGVDTGKVTPMSVNLSVGDHAVVVAIPNSGWNADSRTVTIVSGNNDLSVTLLPALTTGPQGSPGTDGTNGTNGANGTNGIDGTSVTFVGYFAGDAHGCPNGGAIYTAASAQSYVCNGMNGASGSGTRAAGPCFDNTNRYVDCGNGTVTDTVTGLIWLKYAHCLGTLDWASANQAAAALKDGDCGGALTDGSSPGDWRLPTNDEWAATVLIAAVGIGCVGSSFQPSLTNDAGIGCYKIGPSSFVVPDVGSRAYWSSTSIPTNPIQAWHSSLFDGSVTGAPKTLGLSVWPVRGGSR